MDENRFDPEDLNDREMMLRVRRTRLTVVDLRNPENLTLMRIFGKLNPSCLTQAVYAVGSTVAFIYLLFHPSWLTLAYLPLYLVIMHASLTPIRTYLIIAKAHKAWNELQMPRADLGDEE